MNEAIVALILGTATPGGGFPLYGAAFAEMVNAQEPRVRIEARNTKGSTENVPLLEEGKVDLALVAGEIASAALAKPGTKLRIVAAMYSSPGMLIVRGDSAYRGISDLRGKTVVMGTQAYRGISDLRGKTVVMGTQASGVTALGRTVLESLQVEVKPIFLEKAADGPPMLIYVLATDKLREDTAFLLARAIHRAEGALAARLEQARETTMVNTIAAAPRPDLLHPGVRRYLREAKLDR